MRWGLALQSTSWWIEASADGGAPRSLIVAGPGAHFDLASTDPGLIATLVSFLETRLAPPGRTTGGGGGR